MNQSLLTGLDAKPFASLLERLLAIADDAVIVVDQAQRVVLFNDSAERIFGHLRRQVLGQPLDLLLPEAVRARHGNWVTQFGRTAKDSRRSTARSDIQGRRADGSLFAAEASIAHLTLDGQGYFAAILRDVSEARAAQQALAQSEARFRGLADSAPVGIFQTDAAGQCRYVNQRWCQIAGMVDTQALGDGWLRALHPDDCDSVRDAWQAAMQQQQDFALRYRFLRPDGTETWVMGNAVICRDADGGVSGRIGTVTDITDSHRQALALQRAKADAEAAARAKTLFLANMSHEIRTPLNAVIGMSSLLLDTPMSEDQLDFSRTIRASSQALLEIVNDILDYSKADAGKLELEQQVFNLRRCIEDSLDLVAARAQEKGLNLACLIEDSLPEALLGDPIRLRQILVNLLSNAVKFTHQGEVLLSADGDLQPDGQVRLAIAVHDSGIGIAAEHLPRLFQSFSQVDTSTTRKYGGTGLGLAISKRLAELMGGSVAVDSSPGNGSVFTVTLTLAAASTVVPADFLQRDVPGLAGKRLLIVDDNLSNRRILTRLALRWGMLPSTHPSALEALDRLRHGERFDLALLDLSMPGMGGLALAEAIREQRSARQLPIVMLTSLGQRLALPPGLRAEVAALLSKPIKAADLFATLVQVLGGRPADVGPADAPKPPGRHGPVLAEQLPLRVLVAEDNVVNQRVALRLLNRLGYRADLAANGLEVIEAVERQNYDLVLMDIQMPEMDGLQAARWIAQRRSAQGLPRIVAMTANVLPSDLRQAPGDGIDAYLPKPIDSDQLAQALLRVGQHRPGAPAAQLTGSDAAAGLPAVDCTRLDHLGTMQGGDQPTLVRDLIDLFIADAGQHVDQLAEAQAQGRSDQLRTLAHRFLSATQNIGAARLSALCLAIESSADDSRLDDTAPLVRALLAEHAHTRAALAALRGQY